MWTPTYNHGQNCVMSLHLKEGTVFQPRVLQLNLDDDKFPVGVFAVRESIYVV